jgi:hypothetical protein
MAEFFGFQDASKVDANPIIDFSAVTKSITEGLEKNELERERQRKEDAEITQKNIEELSNLSYGSDQDMNRIVTKYAYNAKGLQGEWYKQLTSGKMSRKEYALRTQNLLNGTKTSSIAAKEFNATNQKYVDLLNSGKADAQSIYQAKKIADMQMLNNKSLVIDPSSGTVSWAAVDEKNQIIPGSITDVNTIRNLQNQLAEKVNVQDEVYNFAGKKIAEFITATSPYYSIDDATKRPEFNTLKKEVANYVLSTPRRTADVLVNYAEGGYYLTENQNDTNPLAVKMVKSNNGFDMPKLTPEQEKAAADAVSRALIVQIKKEEERTAPPQRAARGSSGVKGEKEPVFKVEDPVFVTKGGKQGIQYPVTMDPLERAGTGFTEQITAFGKTEDGIPYIRVVSRRGKASGGTESFMPGAGGSAATTTDGTSVKTEQSRVVFLKEPPKGYTRPRGSVVDAARYGSLKGILEDQGANIDVLTQEYPKKTKANASPKVSLNASERRDKKP